MKTERSLKDIRILQIAISALVLVIVVRLGILPALEKRQTMQEEYEAAEEMLAEMQGYLDREPANEARLASAEEEFQELAASYYPLMETQEIDTLITGIALQHNLFPVALSISPRTTGIPGAYLYADKTDTGSAAAGDDGDAAGAEAGDAGDAAGQTDTDGTAEETAEDAEADTGAAVPDASVLGNAGEMVKEAQVTFTVSGRESDVYAMLNDLEKKYPAIQLCSFHRSENVYMDQDMETVREQRVSFVLKVIMYEG